MPTSNSIININSNGLCNNGLTRKRQSMSKSGRVVFWWYMMYDQGKTTGMDTHYVQLSYSFFTTLMVVPSYMRHMTQSHKRSFQKKLRELSKWKYCREYRIIYRTVHIIVYDVHYTVNRVHFTTYIIVRRSCG